MQVESEEVVPQGALERIEARYGTPGEAAWEGALALASRLPPRIAYQAAGALGLIRYRRRRGRMAIRPEVERFAANEAQLEDWKRRQCEQMAYAGLEYSIVARAGRERAARAVRIDGLGHLDAALAEGRGAVLYSFHLCGIVTLFAGLSALGYPLNVIRRSPVDLSAPSRIARARRRNMLLERALGCRFLLMEPENFGVAVKAANALRRNEVVVALVDVAFSGPAVEVELLKTRTVLPAGLGRIAEVSGAPLLDTFCHREGRPYPLAAEIGPPLEPSNGLAATVQQCASRLESHLARHPEAWVAPPNSALLRPPA